MCRKVHAVDDDVTDQQASLLVGVVQAETRSQTDDRTVEIEMERKPVKFKLDTGAQANVIPYSLLQRTGKQNRLKPANGGLWREDQDETRTEEICC
ncbi:hypothetical protein AOLI_G00103050 [Acnodon oligacanthus]